ncbi:sterol carrier protein domain-containing protein, partial [candidate division WOR-3 bacterium]|nr:sterol carrier protein domain-containing protein [candidate division WOR-3 bacterium]
IFMNNSKYKFTIAFDKKGHKIIKQNYADIKISMDIAEFSSMIVGAIDLKTLYRYGLVEIKNAGKIDEINNIFKTMEKPFCLTDF